MDNVIIFFDEETITEEELQAGDIYKPGTEDTELL